MLLEENREELKQSLSNRFKIPFKLSDDFCDLTLYRKTERRGFYVIISGSVVEWAAKLEYDGQRIRQKL